MEVIVTGIKNNLVAFTVCFVVAVVIVVDFFWDEPESLVEEQISKTVHDAKINSLNEELNLVKSELESALSLTTNGAENEDDALKQSQLSLVQEKTALVSRIEDLTKQLQFAKASAECSPPSPSNNGNGETEKRLRAKIIDNEERLQKTQTVLLSIEQEMSDLKSSLDAPVSVRQLNYELERCSDNKRRKVCILAIVIDVNFSRTSEQEAKLEIEAPNGRLFVKHEFYPATHKSIKLQVADKFLDNGTYQLVLTMGKNRIYQGAMQIR